MPVGGESRREYQPCATLFFSSACSPREERPFPGPGPQDTPGSSSPSFPPPWTGPILQQKPSVWRWLRVAAGGPGQGWGVRIVEGCQATILAGPGSAAVPSLGSPSGGCNHYCSLGFGGCIPEPPGDWIMWPHGALCE